MAVPLDIRSTITLFFFPVSDSKEDTLDYLASVHRELFYWKSCHKIRTIEVWCLRYDERYAKHVDLWVHFATRVKEFTLGIMWINDQKYEFPQFAYRNTSKRNLVLWHCQLNPLGSVHWSSLVSLSFGFMDLTEGVMEKVLSVCPNLGCLELNQVWGIQSLKISYVKLRELTIRDYYDENHDLCLEILAPHIQKLELLGLCTEIRIVQRNVASLVTAILCLNLDSEGEERNLEKECSYLKELLHGVAHVENLELGTWYIEELLSKYTNEDEQSRRFETHYFNCSLLHLKIIKFIDCFGPLSKNKSLLSLVKYLLKHATVLKKFVTTARFKGAVASHHYVKMEQEFLSLPRSSPHTSVIFSY